MIKTISAAELNQKFKDITLIDVRESSEHEAESIEGAFLIPLGKIDVHHLPSTTKPLVIHCRSGMRSLQACQKLSLENPDLELYNLEGGILGWAQAGFKTSQTRTGTTNVKKKIPLDRQTMIAAGSVVLSGFVLGSLVSSGFYILCAIAGVGLIIGGITGWCGMTRCLIKMPWNNQ